MKTKFLLSIIFFAACFHSFSQNNFPKGSILLGGNVQYINSEHTTPTGQLKFSSFNIIPVIGVAVKANTFVGISIGYGFGQSRNYNFSGDSTKRNSFYYGAFVRQYKPLKNNFSLFLQGGITGSNSKETSRAFPDFYQKSFSINADLTPGISYQVTRKLQIESGFASIFGIGYSRNERLENPVTGKSIDESFNAFTSLSNFSSSLYLGFRLLLQKKDKSMATIN